MKLLKKVKIINWHYFWNETIEIEPIVFLTGVNASGKSTLIDAMQVVLLGDTTGRTFNKAAAEKSNRTLKGYLRGEIGDTLDGGFNNLRNGRFSSYIALEFFDDVKDSSFTLGIVFDTFDDGSEEHRFFVLNDKIPANEFIENNTPMDYKTLAKFFATNYDNKFKFFESNRQYQDALKKELGNLKDKYFSLLKKAISFTPITDITTFITEYVTESQKNIDILPMQDNILQYKKLEDEAAIMRVKIERLSEIEKTYDIYKSHYEHQLLTQYVLEKSTHQNDINRLQTYLDQVKNYTSRLVDIESEIADLEVNISELNRRKIRLIRDNAANDTLRVTEELHSHQKETEEKIKNLRIVNMQLRSSIEAYVHNFDSVAREALEKTNEIDKDAFSRDGLSDIEMFYDSAKQLIQENQNIQNYLNDDINKLNESVLLSWRDKLSNFKHNIVALSSNLSRFIANAERQELLLRQQEADLRGGGKPYEYTLVQIRNELQNRLSQKHDRKIEVSIFADLIDIKTPKWVNAVEGYLSGQRFNLLVEGKYFLEGYDILKGLLQEYRFFGTNLVDIDRIMERRYEASANSLAEEILTDHAGAKAYTDFLLGRLQKCATPQEARNSGNGITPETDIYRNFTMGRLNPNSYAAKFIGRQVGAAEVNAKKAELAAHATKVNVYKEMYSLIMKANTFEILNTNEIGAINNQIKECQTLPGLEANLVYISEELTKHDTSLLEGVQKRIGLLDDDLKSMEEQKQNLFEERGNLSSQINILKTERIPETKAEVDEKAHKLAHDYDVFFVADVAEPFFQQLLNEGKKPLDINSEFRQEMMKLQYLVSNVFSQLTKLRKDYVNDYRLTYETHLQNNDLYHDELLDLNDVKLPQYEAKINDAYQKAVKQFKDDFISKLRNAIETVEDQIVELNQALSTSTFGEDSYQFTVRPSSIYRAYYDMIKDDLLLRVTDDDSEFFTKYDEVMKNLFAQIVLAGDGDKNAAVLANVEKFTDYRNYLEFDLIVKDKNGVEQRLSRMLTKKSGGETQTPFYISVLASFAYLYRVNEPGELSNSARIIIFDEAFSKMDSGRIKESIRLLRKFGLQAIVSAPSDKVGDISPLVDETLVVLRGKNSSSVQLFAKEETLS